MKTFGVGSKLDRRGWLSVFRQLVAQGFVLPHIAGHGGLSLAPAAAEILRGTRTVRFRIDARTGDGQKSRSHRKSGLPAAELDATARQLWEALRTWRLKEARQQEIPPYVIFHDLASLTALGAIPGIGRNKLERYGSAVIGIVAANSGVRQQHSAGIDGPGSENASAERDVPL